MATVAATARENDEAVEVRRAVNDDELDDFSVSSEGEDAMGATAKLDSAMMNELLLVCSNLGMLRVAPGGDEAPVLMRGEDCEQWIHDLQRAIRRDHAKHKLVVKQLGKWKILQKKLLPLVMNHQHDWSLVFSILKVLVMLTMKPPRDSTNIAQQLKYLREYKHAFLREGAVPVFMEILVEPLAKKASARTEQDYLTMELVLTLLRNLLAIPNEDARFVTSATSYMSHLQQDLICTLYEENVYEMVLLFAQDIDAAENREWNLLVMEMIDLTLGCSTPKAVAAFAKDGSSSATNSAAAPPAPSLVDALQSEKKLALPRHTLKPSQRHSNFGGMVTLVGPSGRAAVVTSLAKLSDEQVPQAAKKPTARKRGGGRNSSQPPITQIMDVVEIFAPRQTVDESDAGTMSVLVALCDSLVDKSYFQLTNSLKGEFRRGSSKLVSTDRLQYFHLVWFLTTYHRLRMQARKAAHRHALRAHAKQTQASLAAIAFESMALPPPPAAPDLNEKAVLSTLDMFSFNFVLQSIETYATGKNYHGMTVAVKLLAEMMAYLAELAASDDVRFQRIADSLQHKLFYERDFLDRLPVLLKTWSPGLFSFAYAVDVVTLTHLVFKILDAQGTIKVLSRRKAALDEKRRQQKTNKSGDNSDSDEDDDEEEAARRAQLLLEMQRKEADFDVRRYFQTVLSCDTIKLYCHVLAQYRRNSAKVNHYVHAFLFRAAHFRIVPDDEPTLAPMLFNIHVLLLAQRMLADPFVAANLRELAAFLRGVVRDFFALAERNKLLFVEALLRQPFAARACQLMQRRYEPLDAGARAKADAVALGRQAKLDAITEARRQKKARDAEDLDGEEEFTFTLNASDFQGSTLAAASTASTGEGTAAAAEAVPRPAARRVTRAAVERAKNWTKVEDRFLKKVYQQYRHLPSVFEVISYEDMFQDRDRTPEQIERRVKHLKLHRSTHDSSDSEEGGERRTGAEEGQEEEEDDGDFVSSVPRRDLDKEARLPRGLESDDESDEGRRRLGRRRRLRRAADASEDEEDSDADLLAPKAKRTAAAESADEDDEPWGAAASVTTNVPQEQEEDEDEAMDEPWAAATGTTQATEQQDSVDEPWAATSMEEEEEDAAMGDTEVLPDSAADGGLLLSLADFPEPSADGYGVGGEEEEEERLGSRKRPRDGSDHDASVSKTARVETEEEEEEEQEAEL